MSLVVADLRDVVATCLFKLSSQQQSHSGSNDKRFGSIVLSLSLIFGMTHMTKAREAAKAEKRIGFLTEDTSYR